jgi:hypothetical protein
MEDAEEYHDDAGDEYEENYEEEYEQIVRMVAERPDDIPCSATLCGRRTTKTNCCRVKIDY